MNNADQGLRGGAAVRDLSLWAIPATVSIGLAIQVRRGSFKELALAMALLAVVAVYASIRRTGSRTQPSPETQSQERQRRWLAWLGRIAVGIQLVAFVPLLTTHIVERVETTSAVVAVFAAVAIAVLAWDQLTLDPVSGAWGRVGLVVAVGVLGVLWIMNNPTGIDVMYLQEVGAERLLDGQNPWAFGIPNPYSEASTAAFYGPGLSIDGEFQFGLPYPPLSLFFALPGELFGDLRYMHLVAMLVAGWLLLTLVIDSWGSRAGGVLFLTTPMLLRVVEWGFTEAFLAAALVATVWLLRRGRIGGGVAMLGAFLATKQYAVGLLPVLLVAAPIFATARQRWAAAWRAVAVAAVVTVPFALWSLWEFFFSIVLFQIKQGFRGDSLSVLAYSFKTWGWPPEWMHLSIIAATTLLGLWWALRRAPRTWAGTAMGMATVWGSFLIVNTRSFTNYYFFAITLLCLAVSLRDDTATRPQAANPLAKG